MWISSLLLDDHQGLLHLGHHSRIHTQLQQHGLDQLKPEGVLASSFHVFRGEQVGQMIHEEIDLHQFSTFSKPANKGQ